MVEQLKNDEEINHDDLVKLQQEILTSLEQHTDPDIVRDLEEVKKTLEDKQLNDQEKYAQIKDELNSLQEKGVVLTYLNDLERKVDKMIEKEAGQENSNSSATQKMLEQIALLPDWPEKDAQITTIADRGRSVSADNVVQEFTTMQKTKGVRWAIGKFFSSKI